MLNVSLQDYTGTEIEKSFKEYHREELVKAIKDRSKLTRKVITDKNGKKQTVWVKAGEGVEKTTKISMFATHNDTNKWAVAVDSYFGLFESQKEAERVYSLIGGSEGDDGLAETAFGSAYLLPPNHKEKWRNNEQPKDGFDKISKHKAIDIEGYIRKYPIHQNRRYETSTITPAQRLKSKRWFKEMFGGSED